MSECKTLRDAPVGEWIEILRDDGHCIYWEKLKVKYKGNHFAFIEYENANEAGVELECPWKHTTDPLEELENKLLEKWQSQGVDFAHDELKHVPHRWILQTMIDAGADIDAI